MGSQVIPVLGIKTWPSLRTPADNRCRCSHSLAAFAKDPAGYPTFKDLTPAARPSPRGEAPGSNTRPPPAMASDWVTPQPAPGFNVVTSHLSLPMSVCTKLGNLKSKISKSSLS